MTEKRIVIRTHDLTKRFKKLTAVDNLNIEVYQGEVFGFLGPNGAGKTTTISMLLGLLRPGGGEARILGLDCWRTSARVKAEVGYLPGDLRLYPWLTGNAALRIFGRARGRDLSRTGHELADYFEFEADVRVRAMFSRSPVASLTVRTFGYCLYRIARSSGSNWVPVRPGMT